MSNMTFALCHRHPRTGIAALGEGNNGFLGGALWFNTLLKHHRTQRVRVLTAMFYYSRRMPSKAGKRERYMVQSTGESCASPQVYFPVDSHRTWLILQQ